MNVVTSFCVLLVCVLPVNALTLPKCQNGQIDIEPGKQASIECTAVDSNGNCTWSITTPATPATPATGGAEKTIGTCERCLSSQCPACDVPDIGYTITRGPVSTSTVSFVANETDHHNATIRCAVSNNPTGATCRINVIEVYRLSSCFVVENAKTNISCSYREPSYGMFWFIKYPNVSYSILVAECPPCVSNPCPDCNVTNTDFRVTRNSNSSVLQMVNGSDVEKDGALLLCYRNDSAAFDFCNIRVFYYKLAQCDGGQLDVSEVKPWTTVSCEGLRQPQNMNWTITDLNGNISQIAFCDSKKNCTTDSSDVTVSRENQYSNLTFVGGVRQRDKLKLTCASGNNVTMDSCRIRTFYPAETNNVTVDVDSNLTVTGRVYIDKVFASDDNITCQWFHTLDNKTGDQLLSSLSLSTFTDTDGLEYQRGHCDMTLSVNSSEITHYFGVLIQPSNEGVQWAAVTIEKPGPNLTTTCPDYVSEGSDLTCECSHLAAQHGNPPATISWRDVTDTADLHIPNVSRQLNGTDYVCTSVWGAGMPDVQSSVDYTLLVAYGPENVTLNGSAYYITDDLQNVTLTCTWQEVYPSVNVTWSVPCMTLTFSLVDNSTCTLDTTLIKHVSGVTCTAVNTGTPQLHATDVFTFLFGMTSQSLSPSLELTTIGATVTTIGATVTTDPSKVQNTATLTLKYLLTVCTRKTENEVETTVHARIVQQSEEWPGLCRDDVCSNAFVTATCDVTYLTSITTVVEIKQVPDTLLSKVNQTAVSTLSVLTNAAQGDVFDLKTIGAVLQKAEILIKLIKTCTQGYTYTGTECVKQDEPSPSLTVVLSASIGGVLGFLVVLILVVLVVVIYRRLGWKHADRQARQDDEHDYSALAIAGQSTGSGHSGHQGPMQLSPLGFELNNSSDGTQHQRPVSDHDVIGTDNPNIASLLTDKYSADEDPGNPYDECDDYDEAGHRDSKVQNSPPEKAANKKGDCSDYLTPSMPRESTEAENPPDYLTLCSPQDVSDDANHSDYLTPQPKLEKSDDLNHSDYLTPQPKLEKSDNLNHSDYLTPQPKLEKSDDLNHSDYLTPQPKLEKSDDLNHSDYLTPQPKLEKSDDLNHADYLTPQPKLV